MQKGVMKLPKDILQDFNKASELSWIDKNSRGDYAFSTCIGMNTRRENGLFVVKHPVHDEAIVLLSKLEESVFIGSQIHEISTNQFKSNIFPKGYKYLKDFEQEPFVKLTFDIEGRIFQKTLFLLKEQSILVVNYELKNQGKPVDLIIKPFLTSRKNTEISKGVKGYNTDSYIGYDFIRWVPRAGMPELYAYFKKGEYQKATLWYHNFEYNMDKFKFSNWNEDLFNPGFFQVTIKPYESFTLFFSTEEMHSFSYDYEYIYRKEFLSRESFSKIGVFKDRDIQEIFCKLNGSILATRNETRIISSTVNHYLSLADALLSTPGVTFVNKRFDDFKRIIKTIISHLDNGVLPEYYNQQSIKENDFRADISLWVFEIIYRYYELTNDIKFIEDEIFDTLLEIIDFYKKNKKFSIKDDSDNLLLTGSPSQDSNWIKLRDENGMVIRYGKLLEINALWYNAIKIMEALALKTGKKREAGKFAKYAKKLQENFIKLFYDKNEDFLFDYINKKEKDQSFRINQLIPLSLSFTPLNKEQALKIFKRIDDELLTPYGLRTLTQKDKRYITGKKQTVFSKSPAYYNGAIWPFTIGFYIQAYKKYHAEDEKWNIAIWKYFKEILTEKNKYVMGYFSDFYIENSDNKCCGYSDYTLTSANIIWSYYLLID
jgi:predicted glycogen debranching enzyme